MKNIANQVFILYAMPVANKVFNAHIVNRGPNIVIPTNTTTIIILLLFMLPNISRVLLYNSCIFILLSYVFVTINDTFEVPVTAPVVNEVINNAPVNCPDVTLLVVTVTNCVPVCL